MRVDFRPLAVTCARRLENASLGFLKNNGRSDNAPRARAVTHLNPDIRVRELLDPADGGCSLTERIAARSSFIGEPAPSAIFVEFPILLPVKKESGHLSWFLTSIKC